MNEPATRAISVAIPVAILAVPYQGLFVDQSSFTAVSLPASRGHMQNVNAGATRTDVGHLSASSVLM